MGSFPVLTKVVLARTRTRTRVFEQGHKRTPGMAPRAYVQNFRSSGYGYDCRTSVELSVRVIPGVNTPGMVLYVPYRTQPWKNFTHNPMNNACKHYSKTIMASKFDDYFKYVGCECDRLSG